MKKDLTDKPLVLINSFGRPRQLAGRAFHCNLFVSAENGTKRIFVAIPGAVCTQITTLAPIVSASFLAGSLPKYRQLLALGMQAKILFEERKKIEAIARARGNSQITTLYQYVLVCFCDSFFNE